jgi:pyrophosphatase PpaX
VPLKAVLFDFDGTLADTLPSLFKAFKAIFAKYDNRSVTEDELVSMFGPTEDEIIANNLKNTTVVAEAISDYYRLYEQDHYDGMESNPEITNLLNDLQSLELKIGVITGKSKKAFLLSSKALQLSAFFDVVITGDDVENPKPHPEGIHKALDLLGINNDEAVFLGDSNADIKAGKAAGLITYGVQWLSTFQSAFFEVEPDLLFTCVNEFMELIRQRKGIKPD